MSESDSETKYKVVGKCRFTVVTQINNAIISNNTKINSISHTLKCKFILSTPIKSKYGKQQEKNDKFYK